jgi:hypothetical protein
VGPLHGQQNHQREGRFTGELAPSVGDEFQKLNALFTLLVRDAHAAHRRVARARRA